MINPCHIYSDLSVSLIRCKGSDFFADYRYLSLNTAKFNSIVLRKLSVFRRLAASRNRCNFAVAMSDPSGFLRNINSHMPTAAQNRLLFIERTGHTYQQKHQEVADKILQLIRDWQ